MKLEWSLFALNDRDDIFDYIEQDSPRMAVLVDERIAAQVRQLIGFPMMGRIGRTNGTRELVISHTSYIAVYRVTDDTVRILRVLHTSLLWPDEMPL